MLALIGLTLFARQFLLLFLAFRAAMPPGFASVTQKSLVFPTVLLADLLIRERPSRGSITGLGLAAAGLPMFGLVVWCSLVPPLPIPVLSGFQGTALLPVTVFHAPWVGLGGALYPGAAATTVHAIWDRRLGCCPAAAVAPLARLSPVTGTVASAVVFGERLTALR